MYYPMYFDPTYVLVLIGVVICMIASAKMNSTFNKYSRVRSHSGMTGREAAETILRRAGIYDVRVERISGNLTDHYDPRGKVLRLSDATYGQTSVAAVGVAAHECGHAIQHQVGYAPLQIRGALVPVANICLLIRDLLAFKFSFSSITIVLFSNVAYGIIAVLVLGKLYNSEAILFGDGTGNVQIFERRSNMIKGGVPSVGDACLVLPVVLVLMIYAGGFASAKSMLVGLLVTQGIVGGVPLLTAWYTKKDMRKTFRIRLCRPGFLFGGLVLMMGTILVGMLLTSITSMLFPESAESMTGSMEAIYSYGYGVCLLLIALLPAVCEELLFRGFLLSSLEHTMKKRAAILTAAIVFGLYHMNLVQTPTTALIGMALCYVAVQSESLLPGMLMHFFNNALSVTAGFYPKQIARILPIFSENGVPALVLIVGGVGLCVLGVYIIKRSKNKAFPVESDARL